MADDMELKYIVDADTTGALKLDRAIDKTAKSAEKNLDKVDKAVKNLSRTFVAVSAAIQANKIIAYADAWTTVNNKLSNSVKEHEALGEVTERVFNIAQRTRASLDSTATLYARLERATRSYGTSVDDIIKITETLNQAMVVSGATAQEAETAIVQLSQGLASGTLRGDEFNAVNENGNRIAVALADSLGITTGQLREMASQGKLTTDVVVKGLLQQGDKIAAEFQNTIKTFAQSTQAATNNLTKFIGESTTVQSSISILGDSLVYLSENLDTVANAASILAIIYGSRLAGGFITAAQARVADAIATQKQAQASAALAAAELRRAAAEKQATLATVAQAKAEFEAARGTDAHALTLDNLIQKQRLATIATGNYNKALAANVAAQKSASLAATTASTAMTGLRTVMAALGGPVGIILTVVSALYMFKAASDNAQEATDRLSKSVNELGIAQAKLLKIQLADDIDKTTAKIREFQHRLDLTIDPLTALTDAKREDLKIEWAAKIEQENETLEKQKQKLEEVNNLINSLSNNKNGAGKTAPKGTVQLDFDDKALNRVKQQLETERETIEREYLERNKIILANTVSNSSEQNDLLQRSANERLQKINELNKKETDAIVKNKEDQAKKLAELDKRIEEQAKERAELEAQQRTIGVNANPRLAEDERFKKQIDALKLSKELQLTTEQEYMQIELQLVAEHEAKKRELQEETFRHASEGNAFLLDTFDALGNTATNVFSGMLSGSMSATDAIKAFGNAIINEAIGALVKMGIEQVKQMVIGKSVQAAATSAAIAQGVSIAAAMQPAAMAASIATSGSAAVLGQSSYASAMAASLIPVAGGLRYGGAASKNNLYEVGESGVEVFRANNRNYMLPGRDGEVISNKELGSMGGNITIVNHFTIQSGNLEDQNMLQKLATMIQTQLQTSLVDEMRPGGALYNLKNS